MTETDILRSRSAQSPSAKQSPVWAALAGWRPCSTNTKHRGRLAGGRILRLYPLFPRAHPDQSRLPRIRRNRQSKWYPEIPVRTSEEVSHYLGGRNLLRYGQNVI